MTGSNGDDTYTVNQADDVIVELLGEGDDTVRTTLANYTLAADLENLTYIGTGSFTGTGNELSNRIDGGAARIPSTAAWASTAWREGRQRHLHRRRVARRRGRAGQRGNRPDPHHGD